MAEEVLYWVIAALIVVASWRAMIVIARTGQWQSGRRIERELAQYLRQKESSKA